MIILGVDPGGITGLCLVNFDKETYELKLLQEDEVHIDNLTPMELSFWLPDYAEWSVGLIVMESIVKTGRLTQGKIDQIRAAERVRYEAEVYRISLVEVTPEERGRAKVTKEILGEREGKKLNHAEDALRAVIACVNRIKH